MIEWLRRIAKRVLCLIWDCSWEVVDGLGIEHCTCCGDIRTFCHQAKCSCKPVGAR